MESNRHKKNVVTALNISLVDSYGSTVKSPIFILIKVTICLCD